jgi:predicted transcriptional regulator
MGQPRQMSKELYEKLKKGFEKPLKVKTKVKAPSGIQTMTMKALKKRFDAEMANRDNEKRRREAKGVKPSGFPMYKTGGKAIKYPSKK